jgi:phage FluMu protein Com
METVTRCLHCGRRLVPTLSAVGRTELKCACCDRVDLMETEAAKWADSPLDTSSQYVLRKTLERAGSE